MRFSFLCSAVLAWVGMGGFSHAAAAPPQSSLPIMQNPVEEHWQMRSSAGHTYSIVVTRSAGAVPATGYPVLYVLDGDALGPLFAAEARLNAGHSIDAAYMIVAVGYGTAPLYDMAQRQRDDTTPWQDAASAAREHIDVAHTGGADAFAEFLLGDLRQELARRYAVDAQRQTLFGHSLGGLFVLHMLVTHPQSYQHMIAASPSLWWNQFSMEHEVKTLAGSTSKPVDLLLSVGEYEQKLSPEQSLLPNARERRAHLEQRRMVTSITALAGQLSTEPYRKALRVQYVQVPEADHIGSVPEAARRALQMAFPPL